MLLLDASVKTAVVGQFHHKVSLALELVEYVNMNDVGVIKRGAGPGLTIESIESSGVVLDFLAHEFDRDEAFQDSVPGAIDFALAAGGNLAAQLELAQLHGHHDGVAASAAGLDGQRRQVAGNEHFGFAAGARDQLKLFIAHTRTGEVISRKGREVKDEAKCWFDNARKTCFIVRVRR